MPWILMGNSFCRQGPRTRRKVVSNMIPWGAVSCIPTRTDTYLFVPCSSGRYHCAGLYVFPTEWIIYNFGGSKEGVENAMAMYFNAAFTPFELERRR